MPAQREEHPGQELPPPRRGQRRVVHPLTTVTDVDPAPRAATRSRPAGPRPSCRAGVRRPDLHRRPGRLLRRRDRHPEAAAPAQGRGAPARDLRPARASSRAPTPKPSSARSRQRRRRRLHRGRRDHLELPPRRAHPRRAGPLRQGSQRDAADADRARPTSGSARAAVAHLAAGSCGAQRDATRATSTLAALVATHRRRPGHADARQLDHHGVAQARPASATMRRQQGHGAPNPTYIPRRRTTPCAGWRDVMGGTPGRHDR